ncbi:hypothetical protein K491DRAFT_773373 [Lophiostoma macrostomum CBS 122681]|uniref:Uncharacterized protein n=1 Tax=Lophiostoma macrostomum CBS 122681 TaxID=1314788 RepID=A0A6A6TSV9_9PLEO|nr:hypothetical protein K491DRAFT_773373 [Lophiostoma macrostomum CBS 122681]
MEGSHKRQRANTGGDTAIDDTGPAYTRQTATELQAYIDEIDKEDDGQSVRALLLLAAQKDTQIAASIKLRYEVIALRRRTRILNFDHNSKDVWYTLNKKYRSLSGSKACDIAGEVFHEICDIIREIGDEASAAQTSFGTKQSGLETLRKIGKTICLSSNDTLRHEVQEQFSHCETCLEDAMESIVGRMTANERDTMCQVDDGRSTFLEKLRELQELGDAHCVFDRLGRVVHALIGDDGHFTDEGGDRDNVEEEEQDGPRG